MKVLEFVFIVSFTITALCAVALAYRPSDELQALQIEKAMLEVKLLERELKAYEDMQKGIENE